MLFHTRARTPTVLQMESVECGAAALAMILGYHGAFIALEILREACGVSRDGSKANNILDVAKAYGLDANGLKIEDITEIDKTDLPAILFWNFNHFVVLEGFSANKFFLNDPACGPRTVTKKEFDESFTGIMLTFKKTHRFKKAGTPPSIFKEIASRIKNIKQSLFFIVLTGVALVVPGLVVPSFLRIFIDNILVNQQSDWFLPLIWGMAITLILQGFLNILQSHYLVKLETKIATIHTARFLWHIFRLPVSFFSQRFGGEISARITLNDKVANMLSGQLAKSVINLMMILFFIGVMFCYNVLLTGICLITVLGNLWALRLLSIKRKNQSLRQSQERSKLIGASLSGIQNIETIKATGSEFDFFSKWTGYHAKLQNATHDLSGLTLLMSSLYPLLNALTTIAILTIGGFFVMSGQMSMGMLMAFQSLMMSLIKPANDLINLGDGIQQLDSEMKRLDDVFLNPPDPHIPNTFVPTQLRQKTVKLNGHVQIRDLTFGYCKLDPPLIKNFSLDLPPGKRVAFVGSSGSGKSTLSKLISGLFHSWSGEILFDGHPSYNWDRLVLTNTIAMVDQDIVLFKGSIRDNLTLWDITIEEPDIIRAAKDACIHDDIAMRPQGYDSMVEEGGVNFSGGQIQRLEIARALIKNPNIIILDEATSSMDALTEKEIDNNLRRRGCTCIIIAHRLSTIRDCDEIIVLDKGSVVERGNHHELIEKKGHYRGLIEA